MAQVIRLALLCGAIASFVQAQQQNNYVGSKSCYACHSTIYQSFQKTAMGRSMSLAKDWKEAPASEATVAQPGTTRTYSAVHRADGWSQTESEPDVFSVNHPLDYAVGAGENGVTFLVQRGAFLFQAPLSWYSRTAKWDFSPGYEHTDLGFNRQAPQECINCHAGRARPVSNGFGAYLDPPFEQLAIGCENCHGPGEAHVRSSGKSIGTIVNPSKLRPRLAENICLNCHQNGDVRVTQPGKSYLDFRPGEWLFDTAVILNQLPRTPEQLQTDLLDHHSAMQASRCFRESGGKLSCLTCHDPHVQPTSAEAPNYFRAKCLTCHNEQSCPLPLKSRLAQKPADDCAGCHMPKRPINEISHSALTNHRIPAREGEPAPPLIATEIDGLAVVNPPASRPAHLSNITLLRAYRDLSAKNPAYRARYLALLDQLSQSEAGDLFVQAALGDKAFSANNFDEAVTHLAKAAASGDPAVLLELGQALSQLGRNDEAIEYLKKGAAIDPYSATMQKTLILAYINSHSYAQATLLMRQYVEAFPEDAFMRGLLARVTK